MVQTRQDDNSYGLTEEQRRMIAFERGESPKSRERQMTPEQAGLHNPNLAGWESIANGDWKPQAEIEAARANNEPTLERSEAAAGVEKVEIRNDDAMTTQANSNSDQANQVTSKPNQAQIDQLSAAASQLAATTEQTNGALAPEAQTSAVPNTEPPSTAPELTADEQREIALAKGGAQQSSQFSQSFTMNQLRNKYGDRPELQSANFTADQQNQFDDMAIQTSRHLNDNGVDVNSVNVITGVNQMDGDNSNNALQMDQQSMGALLAKANYVSRGSMNPGDSAPTLAQQQVAMEAGRGVNTATNAETMGRVEQTMTGEMPAPALSGVEINQASQQLDQLDRIQGQGGFNPDGVANDTAENTVDQAQTWTEGTMTKWH